MSKCLLVVFILLCSGLLSAQTTSDSLRQAGRLDAGEDPAQFITRMEFFSELQQFKSGTSTFYINQTTLRSIIKIGKRFTTRLDLPFVYNTHPSPANTDRTGLGDISFRLLGFKFMERPRSAFTASVEISLNTAENRFLGTGKNVLLPVVSYSTLMKDKRHLLAFLFQEAITLGGDDDRQDLAFSKLQILLLRFWSRKFWTVLAPETYLDHKKGGLSMNLEMRFTFAPKRRINIWAQGGVGIFGDFVARYQWGTEAGCRYFLFKDSSAQKKTGT